MTDHAAIYKRLRSADTALRDAYGLLADPASDDEKEMQADLRLALLYAVRVMNAIRRVNTPTLSPDLLREHQRDVEEAAEEAGVSTGDYLKDGS